MAENKMTQKEMYAHIIELVDDPEVIEFCEKHIEQLNRPRKSKRSTEAAEFADRVYEQLAMVTEPVTAKQFAEQMDVTTPKMAAAFRRLVKEGRVAKDTAGKTATYEVASA